MSWEAWMEQALALAEEAGRAGDVPVGALVIQGGRVIGRGYNRREAEGHPLLHAEMVALSDAARTLGRWNLSDTTLVVTLEPCPMCTGALLQARVGRVVFGAFDLKAGCCGSLLCLPEDPRFATRCPVLGGVLHERCAALLRAFFAARREEGRVF